MYQINFTPFPNLTTEHLALRQVGIEDEEELYALKSDREVSKYIDRPVTENIDEVRKFINKINNGISNNEWVLWAITLKNKNKLIGTICLWNISKEHSKAEVGYELMPCYQGKGIMHEALTAVIEFGFKNMKLNLIEAYTNHENLRSIKLLIRNGFVLKADIKANNSLNEIIYVAEAGNTFSHMESKICETYN